MATGTMRAAAAVVLMAALAPAGAGAEEAWIRIEAKRGPAADTAVAAWKDKFPDVLTFPLPGGMTGIALGPADPAAAAARMAQLKARGEIPADSYLTAPGGTAPLSGALAAAMGTAPAAAKGAPAGADGTQGAAPAGGMHVRLQATPDRVSADAALKLWRKAFPEAGLWRNAAGMFVVALAGQDDAAAAARLAQLKASGKVPRDAYLAPTADLGRVVVPAGTATAGPAPGDARAGADGAQAGTDAAAGETPAAGDDAGSGTESGAPDAAASAGAAPSAAAPQADAAAAGSAASDAAATDAGAPDAAAADPAAPNAAATDAAAADPATADPAATDAAAADAVAPKAAADPAPTDATAPDAPVTNAAAADAGAPDAAATDAAAAAPAAAGSPTREAATPEASAEDASAPGAAGAPAEGEDPAAGDSAPGDAADAPAAARGLPGAPAAASTAGLDAAPAEAAAPAPDAPPDAPPVMPPMAEVQDVLRWAGHYDGPVDGKSGPATRTAIDKALAAGPAGADPATAIADLIRQREAWRRDMGLERLQDGASGLSIMAPMGKLQFDRTDRGLSIYGPKDDSGAALILTRQPGGAQEMADFAGLVTALGWVPSPRREVGKDRIVLDGASADHHGHAEARVVAGMVEGWVLIWPEAEADTARRLAAEIGPSLALLPDVTEASPTGGDAGATGDAGASGDAGAGGASATDD